jgi:hypothetical protein
MAIVMEESVFIIFMLHIRSLPGKHSNSFRDFNGRRDKGIPGVETISLSGNNLRASRNIGLKPNLSAPGGLTRVENRALSSRLVQSLSL